MLELLAAGVLLGVIMYIGKWSVFLLFTFVLPCFKWIHHSPLALFIIDLGINILATKATTLAGGLTALVAASTFQTLSIAVIWSMILIQRAKLPSFKRRLSW